MNRSTFLQISLAAFLGPSLFSNKPFKPNRKLCFNTLGCPNWSLKEVFENANKMGYAAIEIRGILEHVDIVSSPDFQSANLPIVKKMAADFNVKILNLNSSAVLHEYEPEKKNLNLDTAKKYIDIAAQLDCPYIRVFPNYFPKEKTKEFALATIQENLATLATYCKGSQVKVLLDTHSDLVWSADIKTIMQDMDKQHTGILWDFFNMHFTTRESPETMYTSLKEYIAMVQIKDGFFTAKNQSKYSLTGEGEVPISQILNILDKDNYDGYISFEWEKRWHPELAEPEIALPHFKKIIATL